MLHSLQDPTVEDFFLSWWELQSCKVLYPPWGEEQGERNGLLWARRHTNVPDERLPSSSPLISFRSFCACSTASSYQFMPLSHHCEEVATDLAPDPWTLGQVRKLWVDFLFSWRCPYGRSSEVPGVSPLQLYRYLVGFCPPAPYSYLKQGQKIWALDQTLPLITQVTFGRLL